LNRQKKKPASRLTGQAPYLAVAYNRKAVLTTDDQKARRTGLHWGLDITGTLGLLLFTIRIDHIDVATANTLLHEMIAAGYHSPVEDLGEI